MCGYHFLHAQECQQVWLFNNFDDFMFNSMYRKLPIDKLSLSNPIHKAKD